MQDISDVLSCRGQITNYNAVDPNKVPICALRPKTTNTLSHLLNPRKIFPTADNIPKDWRGLAHLLGVPGEYLSSYASKSDPTGALLLNRTKTINIKDLLDILERLERWDIIDDTKEMINEDIQRFTSKTYVSSETELVDSKAFAIQDACQNEVDLELQVYDAFVLHSDEDEHFARELVAKMTDRGLKLCTKDDLMGGQFEHEAVMQLIAERCNRLVVIVSPTFFESAANTFFCNFAQAIAIEQRKRKIIPCVYKPCPKLPYNISIYYRLDYQRFNRLGNFWEKLDESIQGRQSVRNRTQSSVVIREIQPNKEIDIAHSLPSSFSALPQNEIPAILESPADNKSIDIHNSLPELPSLDSLSDIGIPTSSEALLPRNAEKSKRQRWLKKFMTNISTKKDKKKIAVAL